jgi:hypothetical protein
MKRARFTEIQIVSIQKVRTADISHDKLQNRSTIQKLDSPIKKEVAHVS